MRASDKPRVPTEAAESAEAKFSRFRQAYPASRRVGGSGARLAFSVALKRATLDEMLAALEQHKRSIQWQEERLIPLMTTWLRQWRWEQILPEPVTVNRPLAGLTRCPHTPKCRAFTTCRDRLLNRDED